MGCGIYRIINKTNNKIYIGSSVNILSRFSKHKSLLKHNKHDNDYLQNSYNKYGLENFLFEIIGF
jgi:group I intron endonuclease